MNKDTFKTKEVRAYKIPILVVDLFLELACFLYLRSVFNFEQTRDLILLKNRSIYFIVISSIMASLICRMRLSERGAGLRSVVTQALSSSLLTILIFAISNHVLFNFFAGRFYFLLGVSLAVILFLWYSVVLKLIRLARKFGRNRVHCVIVGSDEVALKLFRELTEGYAYVDYKVLGFLTDQPENLPSNATCLGPVSDTEKFLSSNKVHNVYCSINPATNTALVNSIIKVCENLFIDFFYLPNMDGYVRRSLTYSELGSVTIVNLREEPLANPLNALMKRTFDVLFSGFLLCTLFPFIFVFVFIGTKLSSPGPVFFVQERTGYRGRSFKMLKFRSMRVNADADRLQATEDDPRKTRFGNFLRKSSIDELPQLINVFLGDMSIVGPRPHMLYHTELYSKYIDEYLVRHMVKPGLTGWAQINGCRGETKNNEQMADRVRHDIWYIEHWSFALDLKIIALTIIKSISGDEQAY